MRRWYVAYTHAQAEQKAVFHLRQQGFAPYLPQYLRRRSHARKVDWRLAPLFPRYLFVHMDLAEARWRAVMSTPGVVALVSDGSTPLPLAECVVETLRSRQDERGLIQLGPALTSGDRIRVLDGPLAGVDGLFEHHDENERVVVLLDILGRGTRVTLPVSAIGAG